MYSRATLGQLAIALAIIVATCLASNAVKEIKVKNGTIYVKGSAEEEIQSDVGLWRGMVSASNETLVGAYEKIETDLERLHQFLQAQKVDLAEVSFSPITTTTIYERNEQGHQTNTIERYTVTIDFSLTSSNIPQIESLAQRTTALIKEGVQITSYCPQYYYSKIDELKVAMLGKAALDARKRAEELVVSSGSKVGTLRSAHQGVFQITPAYSTTVSDYGEYDTNSITKKIKAIVTMEYAID